MRERLTISIDADLFQIVREEAGQRGVPVSRIVEEALRTWRRARTLAALTAYYQEATLGREDVEDFLQLTAAVWPEAEG
ncbi:hypothetical protein HRbin11_01536 [bacterium HR11]|nr:hypothetical protein HRbin11_01536 [bacterium HR11]